MDDFISTMVWQLFFLIRHKLDNFLYFGTFFYALAQQPVLIISGKLDDLSELTCCASAEGNQMKWTIGPF